MSRKILVIDDHAETVHLIQLTLRRYGYEVHGAQTGQEGIQMAESAPPDLILLDIMMPDMDGLAVCRRLRANDIFRDVPIVMFTAKTQARDKMDGFEAGADDYLSKPTRPKELISRVEAILARKEEAAAGVEAGEPVDEEHWTTNWLAPAPLVVVAGTRGGVGTTTVAVNLAVTLAESGQETVLVDLDNQGHVALYLGQNLELSHDGWLRLPAGSLRERLAGYELPWHENLHLLPSLPDSTGQAFTRSWMSALVETLRKSGRCIVLDVGRQSGETIQSLVQEADGLLLCLRPERPSMTVARRLVSNLQGQNNVHALMLEYNRVSLPRDLVETFLGFPLLDVFAISPSQLTRAVNEGKPLVQLHPQSELREQFQRLAERTLAFAPTA